MRTQTCDALSRVQHRNHVLVGDHGAEELGESPEAYRYQRDRLRAAQEAGWLERVAVDITDSGVSEAIDRARNRNYSLSGDDVTEHEVATIDAVLGCLNYPCPTEQS